MSNIIRLFNDGSAKKILIIIYLLCAFPTGFSLAVLTPPGQVPDEPAHMARAAGLLHGAILATKKSFTDPKTGQVMLQSGVKVDHGLFAVSFGHVTETAGQDKVTLDDYNATRSEPSAHDRIFVSIPNTATYFPLAYIPAALGLRAGLAVNANPFDCMILARVAMLIAALGIGVSALWVATYGEAFILTVLLLPMTLFLAASMNEDGVLISLACLAAAAFTVDTYTLPKVRWIAIACLVIILTSKPSYLPVLGLALVPLEWRGLWRRCCQLVLAAAPVFIWIVIIVRFVVIPFYRPPYHPGPLYQSSPTAFFDETNSGENLHILAAHPFEFFHTAWSTLVFWHTALIESMVGMLGLLDVIFPQRYYDTWFLALAAAFTGAVISRRPNLSVAMVSWRSGGFVVLCFLLACLTVMISFYLSWTDVGGVMIEGLQGRYMLLLLPFMVLAMPSCLARFCVPPIIPALPAIFLGLYDIGFVPLKMIIFYYAH